MASIKLKGDTSGEVTIQTPAVAGTTTYNLSTAGGDILASGDIGVSVQGYDANTAKYDDTTANFTGTLQQGGNNVLDTTSTLSSSNLTGALPAIDGSALTNLPASGKVLQVVNVQHSSTTQLTSSGAFHELSTSFRLSITPQSATSTLYLTFFAPFVSPGNNNLAYAYFYNVTSSSAVNLPTAGGSRQACTWTKRTTPNDPNDNDTINMMTAVASSNTTARTYTIYHRTEGAVHQFLQSTLSTGSGTNTKPIFTIMEVEA